MAYTINLTDGTVFATIPDGTTNNATSALVLVGKNYAGYGEFLDENFVLVPEMTPPTTLAPVMTPVTLTVVPECNVALTLAPPKTLAPVIFPVLFMYPAILAPVDVTVTVVAPAAVSVKLPVLTTLPAKVLAADLVTVIPGKIVGKLVLVGAAGVNAASTLTMAICVLFTYRLVIKCGEPPESFTDPGIAPAVPSLLV